MNILFLRGFSNYFNRVIKKYSALDDYRNEASSYLDLANINFNPNDGVATELIVGNENQKENSAPLDWENIGTPDYCVCYEHTLENEEGFIIYSRWFVLESERTRTGQYRLALKRDVVAEHFDQIKVAPCFVEKGMVKSVDDPLLYNNESMTYNQIKSGEYQLYDNSEVPWIVGYIPKDAATKNISAVMKQPIENYVDADDLPWTFDPSIHYYDRLRSFNYTTTVVNDISNQTYYKLIQVIANVTVGAADYYSTSLIKGSQKNWPSYDIRRVYTLYTNAVSGSGDWNVYGNDSVLRSRIPYITSTEIIADLATDNIYATGNDFPDLLRYNGTIVKSGNRFYRLDITYTVTSYSKSRASGTLRNNWVTKSATSATQYNNGVSSDSLKLHMNARSTDFLNMTFDYTANVDRFTITYTDVQETVNVSGAIASPDSRTHLNDAPYDMFAIPYGDIVVKDAYDNTYHVDKLASMAFAMALPPQYGTANIYDLQLLPYCPVQYMLDNTENNLILLNHGEAGKDYTIINSTDPGSNVTHSSIIIWASSSSGTFNIERNITLNTYSENDVINRKINNETAMYRLVSPNYSGQFEFSVAKNGGSVTSFNVDYTYKPYNPYIHINPDFKGLYGRDYDDARGLICGGDFSLPIVTSAWTDYQVSNKNYQEIFDRQIQNIDVNNQIASEQANWQTISGLFGGLLGGGAGGAMAGFKAGGGWGAAIGGFLGAATGATLGAIGGAKDEEWLFRQQQESKSYTIDMYGYQLGNIKAMPYSLTKTSALTYNNKIFPILEFYECTEKERDALNNKILYDGMTIMAIGQITDYITTTADLSFIRGDLIRIQDLDDDFHIADAIYQEIKKGVYLTPGLED